MHRVEIVEQPARRLIALAHKGPYIGIGEAFQRLSTWVGPRGLAAPDAICLGVFYDDPKSVAAAALRSDACIETGPATSVEAPFRIVELHGGPHATVRFKGPYSDLEDVYAWMFGAWLPGSGREAADRPAFEIYRNSPANC
jgi:AraC family transcriptional regulator